MLSDYLIPRLHLAPASHTAGKNGHNIAVAVPREIGVLILPY